MASKHYQYCNTFTVTLIRKDISMSEMDREELYSALDGIKPKNKFIQDSIELPEEPIQKMTLEDSIHAYKLLQNISSLCEHFERGTPVFSPRFVLADGRRTFSEEDLLEKDYDILSSLDLKRIPLELQVKIADLLWINKHSHDMAKFSVTAYFNLYTDTLDTDHWWTCIEYIKRAITLAQKIGDKQNYQAYLKSLFDKVIEINGTGNPFFSICAAELLIEQKYDNLKPLLNVMDNLLQTESNIFTVKRAYKVKKSILLKDKDEVGVMKNDLELAQYLESQSYITSDNKILDLMKADSLLKEAVVLYRNAGKPEFAEKTHNKLLSIQDELSNEMPIITQTFDVTKFYNNVKDTFEGLSFKEHLILLSQMCKFFSKDELMESILSPDRFFSTRYFGKQKKDSKGRTICEIPALDEHSTEKEKDEAIFFELSRSAQIYGSTTLKWGVELLNERFKYSEKDLDFIVINNNFIPENRKRIFISAIYYGLKGDLYVALHILAPQMEALFRHYAWLLGSNTSTLDGKGIAEDKVLSSVFDDPVLNDGYDEDILLTFKCLMNEKAGSNIRNKVAHGILNECECYNGDALYFTCAVIRVLLLTSPDAYEINKTLSQKLAENQNKSSSPNSEISKEQQ